MTLTPEQLQYAKEVARRRRLLKRAFTPEVLNILKEQFQVNLPCFQGKQGGYDPLDAMRRDAHRELILWIEHEIEKNTHNNDDDYNDDTK